MHLEERRDMQRMRLQERREQLGRLLQDKLVHLQERRDLLQELLQDKLLHLQQKRQMQPHKHMNRMPPNLQPPNRLQPMPREK